MKQKTLCPYLLFGMAMTMVWILGSNRLHAQTLTFSHMDGAAAVTLAESIVKKAYQQVGIEIKLASLPASRSLIFANQGRTDGELMRIKNLSKGPNLIRVEEPLFPIEIMVFTKYVEFPVEGKDSLRPYKVGIINGLKLVESLTKDMQTVKVTKGVQLFRMLDKRYIDVALLARLGGLQYAKQSQVEGIKILEPPVVSVDLFHYLHKRHQALVPKIEHSLRQLRAQGTIQQMVDAYINAF